MPSVAEKVEREYSAYARGEDRPMFGYAALLSAYAGVVAVGAAIIRRRGRRLPQHISTRDVGLVAVGTFQLARMLTKRPITSAIRAPFTEYQGVAGPAELREGVRGSGLRHAVGELVTCPFCMEHWIATAFGFGLVVAPDATRLAAAMLSAEAAADFLQFAYARVEQRVT